MGTQGGRAIRLSRTCCPICRSHEFRFDERQQNSHEANHIRIRTRYSTAQAVQVGDGFLHLVIGEEERSRILLLAVSDKHESTIEVPTSWSCEIPHEVPAGEEATFLTAIMDVMVASLLVQHGAPNSALLIHKADDVLRNTICSQALTRGIKPHFTTGNPAPRTLI
jgi:hypothetical protein